MFVPLKTGARGLQICIEDWFCFDIPAWHSAVRPSRITKSNGVSKNCGIFVRIVKNCALRRRARAGFAPASRSSPVSIIISYNCPVKPFFAPAQHSTKLQTTIRLQAIPRRLQRSLLENTLMLSYGYLRQDKFR